MRLLQKSEVAKAQSLDKAREISEGLKISRRVDSLRELMAQEELTLANSRNESLAAISKEIGELIEKRDAIAKEVSSIRKELESETNLTREERKNLEKLKASLENRDRELSDRADEVNMQEIEIAVVIQEAKDEKDRSRSHREEAERIHQKADEERAESKQALSRAKNIEENILRTKQEQEALFSSKEKELSLRSRNLSLKEEENLKEAREIAVTKLQLADQRKTLERALERIKKNRL